MKKLSLILCIALVLIGCVATPPVHVPLTTQKFTAPLNVELQANTGDSIYVEGEFVDGEVIMVSEPVDLMIPGSMLIPFPVHIAEGPLVMKRINKGWKYYCSDLTKSTATFPGLGTVVTSGDCIGVRISFDGRMQWVVDNSIHNRMSETIWTRGMAPEDAKKYPPKKTGIPFDSRSLLKLTFDGYYGGQLHFTWTESEGRERSTQKFVFDFKGPTLLGIKGKKFQAIKADNVGFTYKWVEL